MHLFQINVFNEFLKKDQQVVIFYFSENIVINSQNCKSHSNFHMNKNFLNLIMNTVNIKAYSRSVPN